MKMILSDEQKVSQILEEFNRFLPYLRLIFYSVPKNEIRGTKDSFNLSSSKTLGKIRSVHTSGFIKITPNMSIAELEDEFEEKYGLFVEIQGKSGHFWLPTTITKNWTLEEQNEHGKRIADFDMKESALTEDEILD